jgi:hypothetical protein
MSETQSSFGPEWDRTYETESPKTPGRPGGSGGGGGADDGAPAGATRGGDSDLPTTPRRRTRRRVPVDEAAPRADFTPRQRIWSCPLDVAPEEP